MYGTRRNLFCLPVGDLHHSIRARVESPAAVGLVVSLNRIAITDVRDGRLLSGFRSNRRHWASAIKATRGAMNSLSKAIWPKHRKELATSKRVRNCFILCILANNMSGAFHNERPRGAPLGKVNCTNLLNYACSCTLLANKCYGPVGSRNSLLEKL